MDKVRTDKDVDKIKKEMKEKFDLDSIEEKLKKSEIEFDYEGVNYKVRKPNHREKLEVYEQKSKKYLNLLQGNHYKLEDKLKEIYKKQGINIDDMTVQMNALESKKNGYLNKLGQLLKDKGSDKDLQTYRNEIEKINQEQYSLSLKKTSYLQYSIETQIMLFTYSYMAHLVTEKMIVNEKDEKDNKWNKVWNSYEEFLNEKDEELINQVSFNVSLIVGII